MKRLKKSSLEKTRGEEQFLKKVGNQIRKYAAQEKKSVERIAYEAGVSKGYAYNLIKGEGNPSVVILKRIASALNVSVSDLVE